MGKYVITKLNESFIDLLKKPEVLKDYCSYYSAIVDWIKQNKKYFNESILYRYRLNVLIKLDPKIYINDNKIEVKDGNRVIYTEYCNDTNPSELEKALIRDNE